MNMENKQGCFWLYQDDVRITGLYGMFSQFTNNPKVYTISDKQIKTVFVNLSHKIKRMLGLISLDDVPILDKLVPYADSQKRNLRFNVVRVYSTDNELLAKYDITITNDEVKIGGVMWLNCKAII